jgi:teichuronic acid biosynthesis glycosyltransferase TuaG
MELPAQPSYRDGLVSVIIPAFNIQSCIADAIESVISQTVENWEAIIIDDASSDATWDVIRKFAESERRIRCLRNASNLGAAKTRNLAITYACGRYLAFLDGDDSWPTDRLEVQLNFMQENHARFVFGPFQCVSEDGLTRGKIIDSQAPRSVDYRAMLEKAATLGCSTVLLDRKYVGEVCLPSIPQGQDYALWLSILRQGIIAYRVDAVCAYYRVRRGSLSRNKLRKAYRQWEIYRRLEGLSLHEATILICKYAWRAVFRR